MRMRLLQSKIFACIWSLERCLCIQEQKGDSVKLRSVAEAKHLLVDPYNRACHPLQVLTNRAVGGWQMLFV